MINTDAVQDVDDYIDMQHHNTSTDIQQPKKQHCREGGKKVQQTKPKGVHTPLVIPELKHPETTMMTMKNDWQSVEHQQINAVTDWELAEYLIGTSIELDLNKDYWPGDKGSWKVQCQDTATQKGILMMVCTLLQGPKKHKRGEQVNVYMSLHRQKDYSIRRALKENYPKATSHNKFTKHNLITQGCLEQQ